MKKILFIIAAFLTFNLSADQKAMPVNMKMDQFAVFVGAASAAYNKAMQICSERGYNYFKVLKLSYKNEQGDIMQMSGTCSDKNGEIIKDSVGVLDQPLLDGVSCDFEMICFKDEINDKSLCDVQKYMNLIKQLQMPAEKVEGSKVIEITSIDQLKKEIESSKMPVFIDCYSATCPPCKMLSPIFDKYSIEKASFGKFLKVNISDVKEISEMYQIKGVPSLLIFEKDGKFQEKKVGLPDITQYLDNVEIR